MITKNLTYWDLKSKSETYLYLLITLVLFIAGAGNLTAQDQNSEKIFKAGAALSVITPKIGTSINGNFQEGFTQHIHDDTHARGLVLDDGKTKIAMVTLDLCMVYRETVDNAKKEQKNTPAFQWKT